LEIQLGKERKAFIRTHPQIMRSAKGGHLSFNARENLLGRCRLLLDFFYPLRAPANGFSAGAFPTSRRKRFRFSIQGDVLLGA
jgi:hypothetical protein